MENNEHTGGGDTLDGVDKPHNEGQMPVEASDRDPAMDLAQRVLLRSKIEPTVSWTKGVLQEEGLSGTLSADQEDRNALRRTQVHSTELEDVSEVEYRQLRLERVILVGIWWHGGIKEAQYSLRELAALADTAGSTVLDGFLQRRETPSPATYLGRGKAQELAQQVRDLGADTVIVDGELTPSARRGLEDVVKVKVVDRIALILDIFAQHAKSREGKAQVELAQLEYLLPRLRGWGESMSRQAGGRAAGGEGIGSRGPGETKIELDRRRIHTRMAKLRRQIRDMRPAREAKRAGRIRNEVPSVAIVGYTNGGKSSLLNRFTGAGVMAENVLFATLDPTVRRAQTPDGRAYTLTDTVGFVRNLPTQLVEAFRSTLEEVAGADVLLHVVDASHPDPLGQVRTVREVLSDIEGVEDIPEILALNKSDIADEVEIAALRAQYPGALAVSALTGRGIAALEDAIAAALPRPSVHVEALIPYDRGDLVSRIHGHGEIIFLEHTGEGTRITARVERALAAELADYAVVENDGPADSWGATRAAD